MLVDDFIMRQIQQIADMLSAIAGSASDQVPAGTLDQIQDAYRDLLGMDLDLADALDPATLVRGLSSQLERDALIDLTIAHAEVSARTGETSAASRRYERALQMMPDGDARAESVLERIVAL